MHGGGFVFGEFEAGAEIVLCFVPVLKLMMCRLTDHPKVGLSLSFHHVFHLYLHCLPPAPHQETWKEH